ncbi:MAG: glycoside hydrolase family 95-like protein [Bacteroidales bacterium]
MKTKLSIALIFLVAPLLSQDYNAFRAYYRDQMVKNHIAGSSVFILNTGITVSNGGLMAPFTDMAKYISFLVGNMDPEQARWVLKRESLEEMFRETIPILEGVPQEVGHYGMGLTWFLEDIDELQVVGHSGSQNAFHTHLYFDPDTRWAYLIGYTTIGPNNRAMDDEIVLLPALSPKYPNGAVKGLCARGGFEVDLDWKNGKPVNGAISSKKGGTCKVRYLDKTAEYRMKAGETIKVNGLF